MPDDRSKTSAEDRTRVNVNEDHELHYWSSRFGCTPDELRAAVRSAGVMVKDVEAFLAAGN